MTSDEIKSIFQARYSTANWKKVLGSIFKDQAFNLKPVERKQSDLKKHEEVKSILELGLFEVQFDESKNKAKLAIYEVELKKGKSVTRNRVGLRNILQHEVVPGDVDAVLATFYSEGSRDWRLTLISKSVSWDHENNKVEWETQPKRYTYVLGETETVTTPIQRFDWLLKQSTDQVRLLDLIKAFSVERISTEFFKGYHHLFEKFEEYMVDQTTYFNYFKKHTKEGSEKEKTEEAERLIRNFIKKLFGRIVFLYFLQKKGWLGVPKGKKWGEGERNFVRNLFDTFGKEPKFYEKYLAVLFFQTLNRERTGDLFSITNTRVPFLNGGLFDKDEIEPLDVKFPQPLFEELFDFFDQYNFTIDENSPEDQDIGIDPEMLGLIFENLLEDNREKGTFYTPKEVVHYMCKESLSAYLKSSLKGKATEKELQQIESFVKFNDLGIPPEIKKYALDIDAALRSVKICDPAIGSGAFPMGMVFEILRVKKEIFGYLKKSTFNYRDEKLDIIKHSIYGVDLDKGAVDIARLRFWLSLIVDEEEPSPLPNLDYRIMQGDSLVESFEGVELDYLEERNNGRQVIEVDLFGTDLRKSAPKAEYTEEDKESLIKLVDAYFEPHDYKTKQTIHNQIEKIIHDNIELIFKKEDEGLHDQILIHEANKATIRLDKNDPAAKRKKKEEAIKKLEAQIEKLQEERKKLKLKLKRLAEISKKEEKPYFLWHLFFRDIFEDKTKGGFDIVIANPPYGVDVDKETQQHYELGKRDSYGVFMSMALKKLLKPGGHMCYIVSDTWLTISSHFLLRQQILDHHHLQKVIRLHGDCFKATVNSCIVTVQTTEANKKHNSAEVKILAADLTNLSTRKNVAEFRDKLFHLEEYVGTSTPEFAVYEYEQDLLEISNNQPIIVGSPKLFLLMDEFDCEKEKRVIGDAKESKEVEVRKIKFNDREIELVRFGDIAEVKQGLATGDNDYYLFQNPEARGNYKNINDYKKYLLVDRDLEKIRSNEKVRKKVIDLGIHQSKKEKDFDKDRWFEGRYIVPYDKGGESDTDSGWLPNYYVPTNYFIDWSSSAISRLATYKIADRIKDRGESKTIKESYRTTNAAVIRSPHTYFKTGISFSRTGVYCPTFRISSISVYDTEGSTIFIEDGFSPISSLGILSSKLIRCLIKSFIDHTVHTQVEDIKVVPFTLVIPDKLQSLVNSIIDKQKLNLNYNYLSVEQKEIDRIIYQHYNLNDDDINEVETWFARRYPKLIKYAYIKPKEELAKEDKKTTNVVDRIKELLTQDESRNLEFKSSLRYDIKQIGIPLETLEHSVFKNIAAFLNTEGGSILIGVEDNQNVIGLEETDYKTFSKGNKKDEFLKHFDQLVQNYFGDHVHHNLKLELVTIANKTVCLVEVNGKAGQAVPLRQKNKPDEFYIRRFASAKALTLMESVHYIKEHWK